MKCESTILPILGDCQVVTMLSSTSNFALRDPQKWHDTDVDIISWMKRATGQEERGWIRARPPSNEGTIISKNNRSLSSISHPRMQVLPVTTLLWLRTFRPSPQFICTRRLQSGLEFTDCTCRRRYSNCAPGMPIKELPHLWIAGLSLMLNSPLLSRSNPRKSLCE